MRREPQDDPLGPGYVPPFLTETRLLAEPGWAIVENELLIAWNEHGWGKIWGRNQVHKGGDVIGKPRYHIHISIGHQKSTISAGGREGRGRSR